MATNPRKLAVNYTPRALRALDEIWEWNAERFGDQHAHDYVGFLQTETDRLATQYLDGKVVPTRADYRYITIHRSRKGHGHIAIYLVTPESVEILNFYHTAQDWQGRIQRGET